MQTYVIHLYLTINQSEPIKDGTSFFKLPSFPIAGFIDNTSAFKNDLPFKIRPFELQQDNLYAFIMNASRLGAKILKIEFDDSIDQDLVDDIHDLIRQGELTQHNLLIEPLHYDDIEIKAVSFLYEGRQYRITKYAVVEIMGEWEEMSYLTETTPLAYVTGIKGFPQERSGFY